MQVSILCKTEKKIEQVEILRALLGKFVAQHFTGLDS